MIDGVIITNLSPDSEETWDLFKRSGSVLLLVALLLGGAVINFNVPRLQNKLPIQVPDWKNFNYCCSGENRAVNLSAIDSLPPLPISLSSFVLFPSPLSPSLSTDTGAWNISTMTFAKAASSLVVLPRVIRCSIPWWSTALRYDFCEIWGACMSTR